MAIRALLACLLSAAITGPPAAQAAGTAAAKASDFLNSIGVCTHITQGKDDPTRVAECLGYAGIHAIRDDGSRNPKTLDSYISVHKASGAKVVLLPINGDIAASLQEYETLAAAGALLAAEGPNETNNWHVSYQGATWSIQPWERPRSRQ
jgi:hypothetical protein